MAAVCRVYAILAYVSNSMVAEFGVPGGMVVLVSIVGDRVTLLLEVLLDGGRQPT